MSESAEKYEAQTIKEMPDMPKNVAQFFPQPYPSASCDTYDCRKRATFFIGRPDGPLSLAHKLCPDCIRTLIQSAPALIDPQTVDPEQLAEILPEWVVIVDTRNLQPESLESLLPENMVIVDKDRLAEMEALRQANEDLETRLKMALLSIPKTITVTETASSTSAGGPAPKSYTCKEPGCTAEPFPSPQALASHVSHHHPKEKVTVP